MAKHVATLDGSLADIHPLTAPQWYGTSPIGSTRFVGRLAEMWQVHSLLNATDVAQITGAMVNVGQVSGLGGVGKSLLAEEYALHFGAAYPGGVFWLRAYGNDDAKSALGPEGREAERAGQMQSMAERLGIITQGMTQAQIEGALGREIERRGTRCLWLVDDVPNGLDGEALKRWFAPHPLARTLITTRSREYGSLAKGVDLSVLAPEEAYQLLTSRRQPSGTDEEEQAHLLAEDLGRHALALDVTASALEDPVPAAPFADFRTKLGRPDKDALELAAALSDALPNRSEKSIAQTLLHSIRGLGAEGMDFLRLASVLAVAPIPASLVVGVFEESDKLSHEDAEERASLAIKQVTAASLAEKAGENQQARSVHTLVSRTVRFHEKASPERTEALRTAAVVALCNEMADAAGDPRLHKQIDLQVAHARQVASIPGTVDEAHLVGWVARYDAERGAYSSASALWMRELEFRRLASGPEDVNTLAVMNNLALAVRESGDLSRAELLQREALAISRNTLGSEHRLTLIMMNQLCLTHRMLGTYEDAQRFGLECLATSRRLLGVDNPDTLSSATNLSTILSARGKFDEARELQQQTLEACLRTLGSDHPLTLGSMNNLAQTLSSQGDLAGARKLEEKTLSVSGRVLGPEHPNTLTSMANLAETLRAQGDLAGARKLEEETLSVSGRVLGPEHPNTLTSMNNLAETLRAQGDLPGARELHEEALAVRRRVMGPEHPNTLTSMNNLSLTLDSMGELATARELQEEALAIQRRVLGPEHPDTTNSAWNLFRTLQDLGEAVAARAVLERDLLWLLDRDPATFGAVHRKLREYVARAVKSSG